MTRKRMSSLDRKKADAKRKRLERENQTKKERALQQEKDRLRKQNERCVMEYVFISYHWIVSM